MGFHPKPRKFFEKNLVKLLVKCNFIAFFVNPFAIFLKPSLGGRQTPQSLRDSSPFMGAFQTRTPSLKGKVASVAWRKGFKAFSLVEKVLSRRQSGWGVNPLIKVLIKRIKFNFFQMESGICRNFFIEKVPCTFKNLFKTAHSMCLRK